jgi:Spy/CpxP family protein refolding chaperone
MLTKRWMKWMGIGAVSAGLLLAQPPAAARRGDAGAGAEARQRPHRGMVLIARMLDLTEEQKAQVQAIVKDARTQAAALAPQLKEQRQAIQDAVTSNPSDSAIRNLADKQGDLISQLTVIRIKSMVKFFAILTPEQKEKAMDLRGKLEGLFGGGRGRFGS